MRKIIILLGFIFFLPVSAQEITITGCFEPKDLAAATIAVLGNMGQKNVLGESKVTEGKFNISLPQDTPQGVYKLALGMQEKVYFYWMHTGTTSYELVFKNKKNKWYLEGKNNKEYNYLNKTIVKEDSLMEAIGVLYYTIGNYPEKKSKFIIEAKSLVDKKIKEFELFKNNALLEAPLLVKEVLNQNNIYFYDPTWDSETIEKKADAFFWDNIPLEDSNYYKKPFFGDQLDQFFVSTTEDRIMSEQEKNLKIQNKVILIIEKLAQHPQRNQLYNLMVRYFSNIKYPQIIQIIDPFLDKNKLLSPEDVAGYEYRMAQKALINQKAPSIIDATTNEPLAINIKEKNYLVFLGENSPFSNAIVQQLKIETQNNEAVQVTVILFSDNSESIQNFKNQFPTWKVQTQVLKAAEETIKKYKLSYVPTLFEIDKNNTIVKIRKPFI